MLGEVGTEEKAGSRCDSAGQSKALLSRQISKDKSSQEMQMMQQDSEGCKAKTLTWPAPPRWF